MPEAENQSTPLFLNGDAHASVVGRDGTSVPPALLDFNLLKPWEDPAVWEMIASGGARAVHHIESPAMIGLCRMCNVRDIHGLVAIVSVIRPGAANENKKVQFTRRYQGLEPVHYPHPSLKECLKSTYGMVVYEEHILQICEAFAGLPGGRADVLRRALGKNKSAVIEEIRKEFFVSAAKLGRSQEEVESVWELVHGFKGYAFCKAHSTAYGVEAYQSSWLKLHYPAEFMASVLTNGKGFYQPLVYILESHRLGIPILPPNINHPGPGFGLELVNGKKAIRIPVTRIKGLTKETKLNMVHEAAQKQFSSMFDFYSRVAPQPAELELMIKCGAFDLFGKKRTAQFWEAQSLVQSNLRGPDAKQEWLFPPSGTAEADRLSLREPTRLENLQAENDLLDFPASGHPLELYPDIAWETYCPVAELGNHCGEKVVTCGLIVEGRIFHQTTGEPMKFLTLADWTGMIETELFAKTYKSYGLATVRYPVLEITATVEPFENGRGHTLRVLQAGKPRNRQAAR